MTPRGINIGNMWQSWSKLTIKSWNTRTSVIIDQVVAGSIILARVREALVELMVAVISWVSRPAPTLIGSVAISADSIVANGWVVGALIEILGTVDSSPSAGAVALVLSDKVCAGTLVLARFWCTLVYVFCARFSLKSNWATALISINQIHTGLIKGADHIFTIINVDTAVFPCVPLYTFAVVVKLIAKLVTRCSILTWLSSTGVVQGLTVGAHVPTEQNNQWQPDSSS